jgi:NNP family nitrate/nitrite transporter-like MFS transporter
MRNLSVKPSIVPDEFGNFRMQLIPILFLVGIESMNMLSRVILSPMLLTLEADLHLSHAQAASFFIFISAGLGLTMFFSGFLSSKITHRQTIILSAVLCGLSLIAVSSSTSLLGIRFNLFLLGMGTGLYLPSGIATVNSLVAARDLGKAMATHELGPTLGLVAAPLFVGVLSTFTTWRRILVVIGLANLMMALIFALFGRGGNFPGLKPELKNLRSILVHPTFWIMTALFGIVVGGEQGVYALLPTYLVSEKGMEPGLANTLFGLSRISVMFTTVISGWFIDRFGIKKSMLAIVMGSGILTSFLGLTSGVILLLVIFLQPVMVASFFPAGFAAISKIGAQQSINVVVSLMIPISILFGTGVVPFLLGISGEYGTFAAGFSFLGTTMLLSTILFFFLNLHPHK